VLGAAFVLLRKNLFEPPRLVLSAAFVNERGILKYNELLPAAVTPEKAHLLEVRCSLFRLTFLDRHCSHDMTF